MTLIEAAKQAREAFEWNFNTDLDNIPACERWAKMLKENIAALNQAIAKAEQQLDHTEQNLEMVEQQAEGAAWQGLTDEEIQKCYETTGHYQTLRPQDRFAVFALARAIEAKLKEKNT